MNGRPDDADLLFFIIYYEESNKIVQKDNAVVNLKSILSVTQ